MFKELLEADYEKLDFAGKQKYMNDWINHRIEEEQKSLQPKLDEINSKLEKGAKMVDVEAEKKELEDKLNNAIGEIKILALKLEGVTDMSGKGGAPKGTIKSALEASKDKITALKDTKKAFEIEVDVVKATQGASDIDSGTDFASMMPGIGKIPHRRRYIKDRIRTIRTDREYIKYLDQKTVVRDAKNVAACGTTTHNTKLTWEVYTIQQQKVRDFVHICLDMMDDYDFVEGEIRNLLDTSLQLKIDSDLLLSNGIAPNPNSIASIASTFDAAAAGASYFGALEAPTIIDLLVIAGAQISAFGAENSWVADTAYLNPRDLTLLKLLKDGDENYIKGNAISPRIIGNRNGNIVIDGVIEVIGNPNVPANQAYIFDSTRAAIVQRKTATVEFSYENRENFETETVTAKGYERLNLWIRNVDANAFMHIDDIPAAIVSLTTT